MSSPTIQEQDAERVSRFVKATLGDSLRKAGAKGGVSHTQVGDWRAWKDAGADPEALPRLQPETRKVLDDFFAMADDEEHRRRAYNLAADRLTELAL